MARNENQVKLNVKGVIECEEINCRNAHEFIDLLEMQAAGTTSGIVFNSTVFNVARGAVGTVSNGVWAQRDGNRVYIWGALQRTDGDTTVTATNWNTLFTLYTGITSNYANQVARTLQPLKTIANFDVGTAGFTMHTAGTSATNTYMCCGVGAADILAGTVNAPSAALARLIFRVRATAANTYVVEFNSSAALGDGNAAEAAFAFSFSYPCQPLSMLNSETA